MKQEVSKLIKLYMLFSAAVLVSCQPGPQQNFAVKPNIIFIMADDLGYGDVGSYGQQQIQTPRLDQMASEGLRFTQFYSGHTVCAPARSSLMTGRHTGRTRVRGNTSVATGDRVPLEPQDTTVAEILKMADYRTGMVGKWGLGEPETTGIPNRKGFDFFYGFLNQARAHSYYPDYIWRNTERINLEENSEAGRGQFTHDMGTEEALSFIRNSHEEPFFLYLPYQIPHAELLVPADALDRYMNEEGKSIFVERPFAGRGNYSAQKIPNATYAAMVTRLDRDVGRILDLLRELEIEENTLVLFTSDNGPHSEGGYDPAYFNSNGPLRGIKRDLYEGGIRVPMIVRMPGTVPAGEVSDQVWSMWDFLPTAAELAQTAPPGDIDGQSMKNALLNRPQQDPEYLYWEFHEGTFSQAVRFGDWKAVRTDAGEPIQVFDLSVDIGEGDDVSEEHPDVVERAGELFRSARTDSEHWPVTYH
ncbi:MAG: arylsulfatase [Balneolales bacterium]